MLEREQDRWFLWLPVLFAGGIITYFALANEPAARVALALLVGAIGLTLAARHAPLGLCFGGAALAFAPGFAAAKLRTETVRAPVLAHGLRYTILTGFVGAHELRDKGRARITLRVLTLDNLESEDPALTMRNVALAALAILLVAPESLFDPSFEMSLVALVALYEWLSGRSRERLGDVSLLWRTLRKGWALISGAAVTTLVAGTAITPFAIYHFHRMTHYGFIANLIAAPLVSLLIMPMAVLSLIAMPFGLEAWPLRSWDSALS